MKNFERAIKVLEFDKIRDILASIAPIENARNLAYNLTPSKSPIVIARMQNETTAAKNMQVLKGMPSFYGIGDISDSVDRAQKGAILTPHEILEIGKVFSCAKSLIEYRNKESNALDEYFDMLAPNKFLEEKISKSFVSEDIIADSATDKLYDIRRKIRIANAKVRESLQKYVTGDHFSKYLQEQIVTMRDGRYVIPVKAEYKNEIKGLVHDSSSSGATLFIEPIAVVETNNEIKILERAEKDEIERFLCELSVDIAGCSASINRNYKAISILALTFAKSQLSYRYDGVEPKISDKKVIDLYKARHPLLNRTTVVPISVNLGKKFDTLVITGPNTGGKTVTLKTLGLFVLMAQSGLHIPAAEGSELGVFDEVLADIGDEQSIEQSLSTFSSHMTKTVDMINSLNDKTLILFDELGAGTDPVEGAALAVSILEAVRETGALCAATTHYAELKSFALDTKGVCNASCEFNIETLKPTYKLIIGTPGKSNAFAISRKLGLSENIIKRAKSYVSGENRKFENVIEKLEASRLEMEKNREETARILSEIEKKKKDVEAFVEMNRKQSEKELEKAREQAKRMIDSAKASSDFVFSELDKVKKERESRDLAAAMEEAKQSIRLNLKANDDIIDPIDIKVVENYKLPRKLHKGDEVILININQKGVLENDPDANGNVNVKAGVIRTKTNIKNLMLIDGDLITINKKAPQKKKEASGRDLSTVLEFSSEIDLRGEYGDDACFLLDKYIDDAKRSGVKSIRVIHGKGTGALRKAVTDFLRKDKRITSVRIGAYGEGDYGVSIAELK